jgi:undecaprenyl-diphosphatase
MLIAWPSWDQTILLELNGFGHPLLTTVMRAVSNVDNWVPVILAAAFMLLWMGRTRPGLTREGVRPRRADARNPRVVLLCLILAVSLTDQTCYHLKHAVNRQRPCFDTATSQLVEYRGEVHGNRSFPSAHAANSAALATITALAYPPLAIPSILAAMAVGFSRVYLGVHYPLDVLAGWGIGVLCASAVWLLLRKCSRRGGLIGFTNRFRIRQPHLSGPLPPGWREVRMSSLDGYGLTGFFLEGGPDLAILVHGLHEDVMLMTEPGTAFHELGLSVLAVPLRGHDGHPAGTTTGGPAEAYDLLGALESSRIMGFERRHTFLYGSSMGAAVAMKAAGLLCEPLAGIIAHAPYESFFGAARERLGRIRTALLRRLLPVSVRSGLDSFRPLDYALMAHDTGFVIIGGSLDRISLPSACAALAGKLPASAHLIMEGAGHPVWHRGDRSRAGFLAALQAALEHLSGNQSGISCVDD